MVLPRKWRLVASGLSAAVAFSATSAIAQEGEDEPESTVVENAVDISTLPELEAEIQTASEIEEPETTSPFDEAALDAEQVVADDESVSEPSESIESESIESESIESESIESESIESESIESESLPSPESVSEDSVD